MTDEERLNPPRTIDTSSIKPKNRIFRYGPLVVWAVLIFIGSGNVLSAEHTSVLLNAVKWLFPSASPSSLSWTHFLIRKAGHLTEYAILATFAAHAFRNSSKEFLRRRWFLFSFGLAAIYSLTDEFHQSFIPSRTASIYDSMIDSAGALIALTIIWLWNRRVRSRRAEI